MNSPDNRDGWTALYVTMRDLILATSKEEMATRSRHLGLEIGVVARHFMYDLPSEAVDRAAYDDPHTTGQQKLDHLRLALGKTKYMETSIMVPYFDS